MSDSPEVFKGSAERSVEVTEASSEQLEKTRLELESTPERDIEEAEAAEQKARENALESAVSVEAGGAEKKKDTYTPPRRGTISKKQKDASFKKQMKDVQAELTPTSRAFSKVIHNKVVEKTSEVIGSTIARPNAILAGAVVAFIATLCVYVIAKNVGYALSGFETIAAFIAGWIIGVVFDYLRVLVTGKPN
jgi:flagellar biosynthesis/type III secretory pathway protein FliH